MPQDHLNDGEPTVRFLARVNVGEEQDETCEDAELTPPQDFPTMS